LENYVLSPEKLVEQALLARQQAYAPYSNYYVGAAVLTATDEVITGCNVENASYGASICAERVALTRAIAQGQRHFVAIAVATRNGATPCGICRQIMAELGPDMIVYVSDEQGRYRTTSVVELLPDAFAGAKLFK
jgi:cytidine deaminase